MVRRRRAGTARRPRPEPKVLPAMRVEAVYRYPVKGLSPEALEEVVLTPGECIPQDRRFALAQGDAPFDPAAPSWLPKRHFGCLMANARLALLHTAFDPRSGCLYIRPPDGPPLAADIRTEGGRAAAAAFLAEFLGPEARGAPRFVASQATPSPRMNACTSVNRFALEPRL